VIINVKKGNKDIIIYKFATEQLSFNNYFLKYLKDTNKNMNASGTMIIKSNANKKLETYS
jgi:hypothetical protein